MSARTQLILRNAAFLGPQGTQGPTGSQGPAGVVNMGATVTDSATLTNIAGFQNFAQTESIAAGDPQVGDVYRISASGIIHSGNATGVAVQLLVSDGVNSYALQTITTTVVAATDYAFKVEMLVTVRTVGAAGTIGASFWGSITKNDNSTAGAASNNGNTQPAATFNTTQNGFTMKCGVASNNTTTSATMHQLVLERIR